MNNSIFQIKSIIKKTRLFFNLLCLIQIHPSVLFLNYSFILFLFLVFNSFNKSYLVFHCIF